MIPRKLLAALVLAAVAALVAAPFFLRRSVRYYTDGVDLRSDAAAARRSLREVLWEPAAPLSPSINRFETDEYEPKLSPDGRLLVFTRGRPGGRADLWLSEKDADSGAWREAEPVEEINTGADEMGGAFLALESGTVLFFYSDRPGGEGGYDIWSSRRLAGGGWDEPANLGPSVNSPLSECSPAPSPDGLGLYFASNRRTGKPGDSPRWPATVREAIGTADYDIYRAERETGPEVRYRPAGMVNALSAQGPSEGAIAFTPRGESLYFASNRAGGRGGFDLYRSRIIAGSLRPPENLGPSINTASHELDPALAANGFELYFARRPPDLPAEDIYLSSSREVFLERETGDPYLSLADLFAFLARLVGRVHPTVLALILSLLAALLFAILFGRRLTRLGLLTRCFMLALLVHLLLAIWMNTSRVQRILVTYLPPEEGESFEVILEGPAEEEVGFAIRGEIAETGGDAAPTFAVLRGERDQAAEEPGAALRPEPAASLELAAGASRPQRSASALARAEPEAEAALPAEAHVPALPGEAALEPGHAPEARAAGSEDPPARREDRIAAAEPREFTPRDRAIEPSPSPLRELNAASEAEPALVRVPPLEAPPAREEPQATLPAVASAIVGAGEAPAPERLEAIEAARPLAPEPDGTDPAAAPREAVALATRPERQAEPAIPVEPEPAVDLVRGETPRRGPHAREVRLPPSPEAARLLLAREEAARREVPAVKPEPEDLEEVPAFARGRFLPPADPSAGPPRAVEREVDPAFAAARLAAAEPRASVAEAVGAAAPPPPRLALPARVGDGEEAVRLTRESAAAEGPGAGSLGPPPGDLTPQAAEPAGRGPEARPLPPAALELAAQAPRAEGTAVERNERAARTAPSIAASPAATAVAAESRRAVPVGGPVAAPAPDAGRVLAAEASAARDALPAQDLSELRRPEAGPALAVGARELLAAPEGAGGAARATPLAVARPREAAPSVLPAADPATSPVPAAVPPAVTVAAASAAPAPAPVAVPEATGARREPLPASEFAELVPPADVSRPVEVASRAAAPPVEAAPAEAGASLAVVPREATPSVLPAADPATSPVPAAVPPAVTVAAASAAPAPAPAPVAVPEAREPLPARELAELVPVEDASRPMEVVSRTAPPPVGAASAEAAGASMTVVPNEATQRVLPAAGPVTPPAPVAVVPAVTVAAAVPAPVSVPAPVAVPEPTGARRDPLPASELALLASAPEALRPMAPAARTSPSLPDKGVPARGGVSFAVARSRVPGRGGPALATLRRSPEFVAAPAAAPRAEAASGAAPAPVPGEARLDASGVDAPELPRLASPPEASRPVALATKAAIPAPAATPVEVEASLGVARPREASRGAVPAAAAAASPVPAGVRAPAAAPVLVGAPVAAPEPASAARREPLPVSELARLALPPDGSRPVEVPSRPAARPPAAVPPAEVEEASLAVARPREASVNAPPLPPSIEATALVPAGAARIAVAVPVPVPDPVAVREAAGGMRRDPVAIPTTAPGAQQAPLAPPPEPQPTALAARPVPAARSAPTNGSSQGPPVRELFAPVRSTELVPLEPALAPVAGGLSTASAPSRVAGPAAPAGRAPGPAPFLAASSERAPARAVVADPGRLEPAPASSGTFVPRVYELRGKGRREEAVRRGGGSPETERAVELGLRWLALHQSPDGGWSLSRYARHLENPSPRDLWHPDWDGRGRHDSRGGTGRAENGEMAATGLAVLAFLGHGDTQLEKGPYQAAVRRGLDYLVKRQRRDGDLRGGGNLYTHGIAAFAICEAYALTRDPALEEPARRAVGYTVRTQNPDLGGWRYEPYPQGTDVDTSVFGWMLMALKSAHVAGIKIEERAVERMAAYLDSARMTEAGGRYAYQPGLPRTSMAMTAQGFFSQQVLAELKPPGDEEARRSLRRAAAESSGYCLKNKPVARDQDGANEYYWYYATLALFQEGGEAWKGWNARLKEVLLDLQLGEEEGTAAGSWDPVSRRAEMGGRVYSTAISVLSLEVYYRYAKQEK